MGHFQTSNHCFWTLTFPLDVSEILPDDTIRKWLKVTVLNFEEKLKRWPKLKKWVIMGLKIHIFKLLSKSSRYVFMKLCLKRGVKKSAEVAFVDFEVKLRSTPGK